MAQGKNITTENRGYYISASKNRFIRVHAQPPKEDETILCVYPQQHDFKGFRTLPVLNYWKEQTFSPREGGSLPPFSIPMRGVVTCFAVKKLNNTSPSILPITIVENVELQPINSVCKSNDTLQEAAAHISSAPFEGVTKIANIVSKSSILDSIKLNVLSTSNRVPAHVSSKFNELVNSNMDLSELKKIDELLNSDTCSEPTEKDILLFDSFKFKEINLTDRKVGFLYRKPFRFSHDFIKDATDLISSSAQSSIPAITYGNKEQISSNPETIDVVEKLKRLRKIVSSITAAEVRGSYNQNELFSDETLGD